MSLDDEAGGHQILHRAGAAVQRHYPVATGAMKMVVVVRPETRVGLRAGRLETRRLAGQQHLDDAGFVKQAIQLAVDRRQVQAGHGDLRRPQNFSRCERMARLLDGLTNRFALTGVAFHDAILMQTDLQQGDL